MSSLETLVPSLKECRKIPAGSFPDTALVWEKRKNYPKKEWKVLHRSMFYEGSVRHGNLRYPAPTLAEILEALNNKTPKFGDFIHCRAADDGFWKVHNGIDCDTNRSAVDAALRLWMRGNGI